ncbi:MAG: hypothetical protein JWQ90_3115 [Hydrocarboniphaga sp.]|uniref:hypothetical protein n=1 Tax=Hydrocarboniphaga sp. TaxID=2033016 RepID=UPI0026357862|nr:hypothetical protein [Hydrocarboniphaga sp.]MDB5970665.1 hypothetical protein [Hydrocarboniphaga sp.]
MTGQWSRFFAMAARDGVIVAITVALWILTIQVGKAHDLATLSLHLGTAALTVVASYLAHEWGHLIGAWLIHSRFFLPGSVIESPFLFRFDNIRNTREHFVWMAWGGFVSSGVLVVFLVIVLPKDLLAAQLALGLTALGVLATLVIEVPGFWRVYRGAPLPKGAAFISPPEV